MKNLFAILSFAVACISTQASPALAQNAAGEAAYEVGERQAKAERFDEARISYKAACDAGFLKGCAQYGRLLRRGEGGAKDPNAAMGVLTPACDRGEQEACAEKGAVYLDGEEYALAQPLLDAACAANVSAGCTNGGYMYENGLFSKKPDRAYAMYSKSCELGNKAGCHNLGVATRDGVGRFVDKPAALAMMKRNCDQRQYARSCYAAALLFPETDDANRLKYYKLGCDGGNSNACHYRGAMYHKRLNDATASSAAEVYGRLAREHYDRACELGRTKSCNFRTNAAGIERGLRNREQQQAQRAEYEKRLAKYATARRQLQNYHPGAHGCRFQSITYYEDNQASLDNAKRLLNAEGECLRQFYRNETQRLNAIMGRIGGSVKLIDVSAKSSGRHSWTWTNACGCEDDLKAATKRLVDEQDKLLNRHNRRVDSYNKPR